MKIGAIIAQLARAVLGRSTAGAARVSFGWRVYAIAACVVIVLVLGAFAAGAWFASDRAAQRAHASAQASIADAERRAADALSLAEAARLRADRWQLAAAQGDARASELRLADARSYMERLNRVLAASEAGGRCLLSPEFGGMWNAATDAGAAP